MSDRRKHIYVRAIAQVSCQEPLSDAWFDAPVRYEERYVRAQEPDARRFMTPGESRRMSRILKRSLCTSLSALEKGGMVVPQAVITGTGMGCMENSEKFLEDLTVYGENCLKPTLFMQSTHNTISSQIAIKLKCHGYNNTYSQRDISFESALLDACLQLRLGMVDNVLVGSHDEVTPLVAASMKYSSPEYRFISEASVSVLLVNEYDSERDICEIRDIKLWHDPDMEEIRRYVSSVSASAVVMGLNGNPDNDKWYQELIEEMPENTPVVGYRDIFGDNYSSSAIGFYASCVMLERRRIPRVMIKHGSMPDNTEPESILILHRSSDHEWSAIVLGNVDGKLGTANK